jgi:hypothetical protein
MDCAREPRGPFGDPRGGGGRSEPTSAQAPLAERRVVAIGDARDLVGATEIADMWRLQRAHGGRLTRLPDRRVRGEHRLLQLRNRVESGLRPL